jgi:hypothetical protein
MIALDDEPLKTTALQCGRCANPMVFVTEISDPKTSARRRLYECPKCRSSAFTAGR